MEDAKCLASLSLDTKCHLVIATATMLLSFKFYLEEHC